MMRFLAELGLGKANDQVASVSRHVDHLGQFLDRLIASGAESPEERVIRVVARSAESAPLMAMAQLAPKIVAADARARIVLAWLEPAPMLQELTNALGTCCQESDGRPALRWAKNPRLLDAHEQMTFGHAWCWSGDMMKRSADRRNALDLFEEDAHSARLGRAAFDALWMASAPVPAVRLRGISERLLSQLDAATEEAIGLDAVRLDALRPLTWH